MMRAALEIWATMPTAERFAALIFPPVGLALAALLAAVLP